MKRLIEILKNGWKQTTRLHLACFSLLFISITFSKIFEKYPVWAETFYYRTLFIGFRRIWDPLIAIIPFPVFYIWMSLILGFIFYLFRSFYLRKISFIYLILNVLSLISFQASWFYWTWAYNYNKPSLGYQWNLLSTIQDSEFNESLINQTNLVDSLRNLDSTFLGSPKVNLSILEQDLRSLINAFQAANGFPVFPGIRCRSLNPPGILMVWSTSGVYLPFIGESQIDAGLSAYSIPFTMAHELAHGAGWTNEGDCNFIAYLACRVSKDAFIRYSTELNYWRYLLSTASNKDPQLYKQQIKQCSDKVKSDLKAIHEANNRYPELIPALRDWFYDWYLKQNGISNGEISYSDIITLVINYNKKKVI